MDELYAVLEAHCFGASKVNGDSGYMQVNGCQTNQPIGLINVEDNHQEDNHQSACWSVGSPAEDDNQMHQTLQAREELPSPKPVQSAEASQSGQTEQITLTRKGSCHQCAVCNDVASGFHYGVWSCEGCKAFFKRSIQGHVDYVCPATNTCMIDKQRRKSCQACRLRKCHEAGMCKTSVKTRLVNKNKNPVKRKSEAGSGNGTKKVFKESSSLGSSSPVASQPQTQVTGAQSLNVDNDSKAIPQALQLISKLVGIEPAVPEIDFNFSEDTTRKQYLAASIASVDKELINNINWAKQVPEYSSLTLNDQVHLLECCWFETILFRFVYRCIPYPGKLYIGPNFIIDREFLNSMGLKNFASGIFSLVECLTDLRVTKEEYILLKALTLFNPDKVSGLEDKEKLGEIQDRYMRALMDYVSYIKPNNPTRSAHLLFFLSSLGRIAHEGLMLVYNIKSSGMFPVCELLSEMLEAHKRTDTFSDIDSVEEFANEKAEKAAQKFN